jgi:hypothetical protein
LGNGIGIEGRVGVGIDGGAGFTTGLELRRHVHIYPYILGLPGLPGVSVLPVFASISASHSVEPTGLPTVSAFRNEEYVSPSSKSSPRKGIR